MSQKRSFSEISSDFVENNPTKRIRQITNRFGRRESAVNYNSFFEQALEDFSIDQQFECQPFNTCDVASPIVNERFEQEESIENNLHQQIIATISMLNKQMIDFNKRLGNCELKICHQLKEDRKSLNDTGCDIAGDFMLPVEDTKSLNELESKLKNRPFKILQVNNNAKSTFV